MIYFSPLFSPVKLLVFLPLFIPSCLFLLIAGNGLGIRVVGGKEIPGNSGEIGAYIAKILPGGSAEQTGKLMEGKRNQSLNTGKVRLDS